MKVEKLLTLSQFIDTYPDPFTESVINYNNFLRQPLTKDMFINDVRIPFKGDYGLDAPEFNTYKYPIETYESDLAEYEEAEKKVIFNHPKEQGNVDIIILAAKTIGGYANAMGGEVELNNVEI